MWLAARLFLGGVLLEDADEILLREHEPAGGGRGGADVDAGQAVQALLHGAVGAI